jgi:hypothetical protein
VDGHWSPDGQSLAVTDVAGQWSLYGHGEPDHLLLAAPYDQFFDRDYSLVSRAGVCGPSYRGLACDRIEWVRANGWKIE